MSEVPPNISPPQWGLYANGVPVLVADSVFGVEYARDYKISDYQQEQGAFASYNKVQTPYIAKVTYLVGSSGDERAAFLAAAEQVVASLNLVTIFTPEIPYLNANPTHIGYRRTAEQGVSLLMVEIWCEQVRIIGAGALSNTQSINGASATQNGNTTPQQAAAPATGLTPSQQSAVTNISGGATAATVTQPDSQGNVEADYVTGGPL
jgi:hypothetical protein